MSDGQAASDAEMPLEESESWRVSAAQDAWLPVRQWLDVLGHKPLQVLMGASNGKTEYRAWLEKLCELTDPGNSE